MRKGQRRDASQATAIFPPERKRNTESASWSCSDFWKREKNRKKVREWIRIFPQTVLSPQQGNTQVGEG